MLNDVTFGQYYPSTSFVHKLDPRLKLLFLIVYIVALFIAQNAYGMILCGIVLTMAIVASRVPFKSVLRSVKGILFLLILTSVLNLFFHTGEHLLTPETWVVKIYAESITFTIFLVCRLFFLVMASAILTLTTTPVSLTDGMESLLYPLKLIHFPVHVLALIMSIALRFIPTLIDETNRIISAQKARGADFESGHLIKRIKALVPILIPLLVSAFRRADELGDAMDARCYNNSPNRTKYKKLTFTAKDAWAALIGILLLTGVILFNRYGQQIWPAGFPYLTVS